MGSELQPRPIDTIFTFPPSLPPSLPLWLSQLFQDMWKREPTERPSAKEVVVRLEAMQAALPKDS